MASGDIALTIDALHADENGLRAERATLEQQEARDQATTNQEATLANAARQTEVQLTSKQSESHGPARRGRGPTTGGTGRGGRRRGPGGTGQGCRRSGHVARVTAAFRQLHGATGKRCQHVVGRPVAASPSSNASCRPSQAATTTPSRRGARTWAVSNSARRRGTKRPSWPACHSSSTSPRTRRLRPSRTTSSPSRSTRPMAGSPGRTPVGRADARPPLCAPAARHGGISPQGPSQRWVTKAEQAPRNAGLGRVTSTALGRQARPYRLHEWPNV